MKKLSNKARNYISDHYPEFTIANFVGWVLVLGVLVLHIFQVINFDKRTSTNVADVKSGVVETIRNDSLQLSNQDSIKKKLNSSTTDAIKRINKKLNIK